MQQLLVLAIAGFLAVGAEKTEEGTSHQFDAAFPHDPSGLSYVIADDKYTFPNGIVNLTLCFWLKPSADTELSVLSYNTYPSTEWGNPLGWYWTPNLKKTWLCIHENCIEMGAPSTYELNEWHHFCVIYNGVNPKVTTLYNGEEKFEAAGDWRHKNRQLRGGGKVVLGQDQDSYGGGFDAKQSMRGRISRLQLWDRILTDNEVKLQIQCDASEGNVIAWTKVPWRFENGATEVFPDPCPAKATPCPKEAHPPTPICSECDNKAAADLQLKLQGFQEEIRKQQSEMKDNIQSLQNNERSVTSELDTLSYRSDATQKTIKQFMFTISQEFSSFKTEIEKEMNNLHKSVEAQKSPCPENFVQIGGRCYFFSTFVLGKWTDALMACRFLQPNATLLTLESNKEWLNIQYHLGEHNLNDYNWWFNGQDSLLEGNRTTYSAKMLPACGDESSRKDDEFYGCLTEVKELWCAKKWPCTNSGEYVRTKFICEYYPLDN